MAAMATMAQNPDHRPDFRHDEGWEPHHHHEDWRRRDWDRHEGCERREHEHRQGADIRIDSRQGDLRHKVILVENNSPRAVTIAPEAEPWMDAHGTSVPTTVTFEPKAQDLAPGEAKEFRLAILVA